ncbi:MAG: monofunctional biosynthetic peptidoglycan transglycosylase [Gammaproteobacteria bacterium]
MGRWLIFLLVLLAFAPPLLVRWVTPPISAFMAAAWVDALHSERSGFRLDYQAVPRAEISPALALAVIAAEDQNFPRHAGFDFKEISNALREQQQGLGLRGASTLSQQLVKNLFLWSGRSWLRKGLETWFTFWLEIFCGKPRILELYLNFAQFGEGVYGAAAASRIFFDKRASELNEAEAALLAAVLPNPLRLNAAAPSAYVRSRQQWIRQQMRQLGGIEYLRDAGF